MPAFDRAGSHEVSFEDVEYGGPAGERLLARIYRPSGASAGGEAELALFPGVGHSFANFPGEAADRCIAAMKCFIAAQLAP